MTGGNLQIAYLFIAAASLLIATSICTILIAKGIRAIRHKEWLAAEKKLEPYFTELKEQLSTNEALKKPGRNVNRIEWLVIQDRLMEWTARVGGEARERLTALCEELGFVDKDLRTLRKKRGLRQSAAAYRLGMMRSPRAAEPLLRVSEELSFQSSTFIYARALAMCARNADDLERMVKAVTKHRRPVQNMLTVILEEAGEYTEELIQRLQKARDPMLRSIADQYMNPQLPASRPTTSLSKPHRSMKNVQHEPSSEAI